MRKSLTLVTVFLLSLTAYSATADAYRASVESCRSVIGEKLGVSESSVNYDIQKIKTKARYRDIRFSVSAFDANSPLQGVKVKCRSRRNGEIVAIDFDASTLPASIALK